MLRFLARRFLNYLVLVFIATSLAYILASVTFHPENRYNQRNPPIPPAVIEATLKQANADPKEPVIQRYGHWLDRVVLHADFGTTLGNPDNTVASEMGRRMLVSVRLLLLGSIFGTIFGVLVGVFGAVRQRGFFDNTSTVLSYVILASLTPVIIIFVQTVAYWISNHVFHSPSAIPLTGEYLPGVPHNLSWWLDRLKRLILPTICLSVFNIAFFSRYQRSAMLDVLGSDFLRTARAKGLRRRQALMKHGVRTALIPMATFFAYTFGLLVTGATFTEKLFGWHGMGEYLVDSIGQRDINAVAATTAFVAVLVLISGMLSDIIYAALDPRVRSAS